MVFGIEFTRDVRCVRTGKKGGWNEPADGESVRERRCGCEERDDGVESCGRLQMHVSVALLKGLDCHESKLTPMLIKAMMTRIERENMIELSGMGVPMVVTCNSVSMIIMFLLLYKTNLAEPRGEGQGLISSQ